MAKDWDNDTKEKHADTLRKLNEHENNLLNMRFTWFTTLQGLLFASLGIIWKEKVQSIVLPLVICSLGIVVAISFFVVVKLTGDAYKNLRDWWKENLQDYDGPPLKGIERSSKMTFMRLLRPWRILPLAFIIAWVAII